MPTTELIEACTVLFGEETVISPAFLRILEPSGIKSAYRRKVRETHPDQALRLGVDESVLAEKFKRVNRAYEYLQALIRHKGLRRPASAAAPLRKKRRDSKPRYYSGSIPRRPLPLGQFLYYSGAITWQDLIQAVLWQRSSRPPIGMIARQWGVLTSRDVRRILAGGPAREKFGERALRYGYVTPFQLLALLGHQKKSHCPIGHYFLRKRLLTAAALSRHLAAQRRHNRRCRPFSS